MSTKTLNQTRRKESKMRNKALIAAIAVGFLGCINLNAYDGSDVFNKHLRGEAKKEAVDCSDPKNRPDMIAGILVGGEKRVLYNCQTSKA